jgi:hypothetical protein
MLSSTQPGQGAKESRAQALVSAAADVKIKYGISTRQLVTKSFTTTATFAGASEFEPCFKIFELIPRSMRPPSSATHGCVCTLAGDNAQRNNVNFCCVEYKGRKFHVHFLLSSQPRVSHYFDHK